jgi:hypothetical protein
MKLSAFKQHLNVLENLNFLQPNGEKVPAHFHITEIGLVSKHFVDCGGDVHQEKSANIQIWVADDLDHRLDPAGLLNIIDISKKVLGDEDLEIEVEYQTETIGKYALDFKYGHFVLVAKQTDCLAKLQCGIPQPKRMVNLAGKSAAVCTPGGGCC